MECDGEAGAFHSFPSGTAGSLPRELEDPHRTHMQAQLTLEFYVASSSDIEIAEECLENGQFP